MRKPVYIGIDLGLRGAICAICDDKVIGKYPMPLTKDKKSIDINELKNIIMKYSPAFGLTYIKQIGFENILRPMYGTSKISSIQMGRQYGQIEAISKTILEPLGTKITPILPVNWQKEMFKHIKEIKKSTGRRDTKKMALEAYKKHFPKLEYAFTKRQKVHDGLVDACLIAKYLKYVS